MTKIESKLNINSEKNQRLNFMPKYFKFFLNLKSICHVYQNKILNIEKVLHNK